MKSKLLPTAALLLTLVNSLVANNIKKYFHNHIRTNPIVCTTEGNKLEEILDYWKAECGESAQPKPETDFNIDDLVVPIKKDKEKIQSPNKETFYSNHPPRKKPEFSTTLYGNVDLPTKSGYNFGFGASFSVRLTKKKIIGPISFGAIGSGGGAYHPKFNAKKGYTWSTSQALRLYLSDLFAELTYVVGGYKSEFEYPKVWKKKSSHYFFGLGYHTNNAKFIGAGDDIFEISLSVSNQENDTVNKTSLVSVSGEWGIPIFKSKIGYEPVLYLIVSPNLDLLSYLQDGKKDSSWNVSFKFGIRYYLPN